MDIKYQEGLSKKSEYIKQLKKLCGEKEYDLEYKINKYLDTCNLDFNSFFLECLNIATKTINIQGQNFPLEEFIILVKNFYVPNKQFNQRLAWAKIINFLKAKNLYDDPYGVTPIWPHNGMLILNPFLGCSFGCVYCFRAPEQTKNPDWFLKGKPIEVEDPGKIIEDLEKHPLFFKDKTQLGLHTATTDPFLPQVKEATFKILSLLNEKKFKNDVMIITKYYLTKEDILELDKYENFNILLLLTFNNTLKNVEVAGGNPAFKKKQWETLDLLEKYSKNILFAHYYRPIVIGWNDKEEQISEALKFGNRTGITIIGGIKYIDGLNEYAAKRGLSKIKNITQEEYKLFPKSLVEKILSIHAKLNLTSTIVGDQSCGLTLLLSKKKLTPNVEAVKLYDRILERDRPVCMGLCPKEQLEICSKAIMPEKKSVQFVVDRLNLKIKNFEINEDGIFLNIDKDFEDNNLSSTQICKTMTGYFKYPVQIKN